MVLKLLLTVGYGRFWGGVSWVSVSVVRKHIVNFTSTLQLYSSISYYKIKYLNKPLLLNFSHAIDAIDISIYG